METKALEQVYESISRQEAVSLARHLARETTEESEEAAEQISDKTEEISAAKLEIEEMSARLAALEQAVSANAQQLPLKRTECLEASNEWRKLVTVTNAASEEKVALLHEELYMDAAIKFYRGEAGYPAFLSPWANRCAPSLPYIPERQREMEDNVELPISCPGWRPEQQERAEILHVYMVTLEGSPADWQSDVQFMKFKTEYEGAVAAFNKRQVILGQLKTQLNELLSQKADLQQSISTSNQHVEQLQQSLDNCDAFLTKAGPGIQNSGATKAALVPELDELRCAMTVKRAEVEMLEQAWPGEPCVNHNGSDSGPAPYRWATLEFAMNASSAAAGFKRAVLEAQGLEPRLLEDLFRVSVEREVMLSHIPVVIDIFRGDTDEVIQVTLQTEEDYLYN